MDFSYSFVIVSWNAREHLLACLESLLSDPVGREGEIIVVDNASSDGSPQAVARCFPQVKLILNKQNLGFAAATNQGLEESSGKYVFLINSDVIVLPGCLEALIGCFEAERRAGLLGPRLLNPDRSLQPSCMIFPSLRSVLCRTFALDKLFPKTLWSASLFLPLSLHDRTREVDGLSGAFWAVRREALREVGLLDEGFFMYGEDIDWCRRFHRCGWRVIYCAEAEAIHVGGASSANAPLRFARELVRANLRYWRKHHGLGPTALVWLLALIGHASRALGRGLLSLVVWNRAGQLRKRAFRSLALVGFLLTGLPRAPKRPATSRHLALQEAGG